MFHIIADTVYIATLNQRGVPSASNNELTVEKNRAPILEYILRGRSKN